MTGFPEIKVPRPDELDAEFYQAVVKAGALSLQRCDECGTWTHPARYYCPNCSSGKYSFVPASGRATVYSYTVSHMSVEPAWQALVPYVTILVPVGSRTPTTTPTLRPSKRSTRSRRI